MKTCQSEKLGVGRKERAHNDRGGQIPWNNHVLRVVFFRCALHVVWTFLSTKNVTEGLYLFMTNMSSFHVMLGSLSDRKAFPTEMPQEGKFDGVGQDL